MRTVFKKKKTLSNSDSCYDLFYSLILFFLVEGHLPFMTPAVLPPLNERQRNANLPGGRSFHSCAPIPG